MNAVSFIDINNGIVVAGPTILRTTNGGETWTRQISDTTSWLSGVYFINTNNAIVVGENGTILHTTNGGTNWISQSSGTWSNLESVHFVNENVGWVVGYYGTILKTTNGGVTFVEEHQIDEMPKEFLLSQNYPNPFNPSTKIQYQVSNISHVSLVVYDILGNEIETMVNEEKSPGKYETNWNAAGLPSGVYFYQLRTGSFVETKKMILLR